MTISHEGGCVCGAVRYRVKAAARPGPRGISAGTFDDKDWFRVDRHIWARSARPWGATPPKNGVRAELFS